MRPKKNRDVRTDVAGSSTGRAPASRVPSQLWAFSLERWVCSVNIERMRAQLATATTQPEQAMLRHLLREQEDTLERLVENAAYDVTAGVARTGAAMRLGDVVGDEYVLRPLDEEPFH